MKEGFIIETPGIVSETTCIKVGDVEVLDLTYIHIYEKGSDNFTGIIMNKAELTQFHQMLGTYLAQPETKDNGQFIKWTQQ